MIQNLKQIFPIYFLVGFNILTILFFFISPVQWETRNLFLFGILSLISQLFVFLGFRFGFNNFQLKFVSLFSSISPKIVNFIFIFYSFTFIFKYAYLLKLDPFALNEMFNYLLVGFIDPQLGYKLSLDNSRIPSVPWSFYFIISLVNQIYFIFGFISWNNLRINYKLLFLFFLSIEIFYWLGRGTSFGIVSLSLTFLLTRFFTFNLTYLQFKVFFKYLFYSILILFLVVYFFSYNLFMRSGQINVDYTNFDFYNSRINPDHFTFSLIPTSFHSTYLYIIFYLCQGYFHTCYSFDLDFIPTFFSTNNPALISFLDIFGINFFEDSYIYRLEEKYGIDSLINWHSSYTWFASDFSYFGVPLLFLFIGFFCGISWKYIVFCNDLLSKVIFIFLASILFFVFANNNYLSSVFYSFSFLFPLWIFTRVLKIKY